MGELGPDLSEDESSRRDDIKIAIDATKPDDKWQKSLLERYEKTNGFLSFDEHLAMIAQANGSAMEDVYQTFLRMSKSPKIFHSARDVEMGPKGKILNIAMDIDMRKPKDSTAGSEVERWEEFFRNRKEK